MGALPVAPEWEPVRLADLPAADPMAVDRVRVEQQAARQGLQPVRWPAAWPPDSGTAMLAATYAKHVGRAVAFSLAAFRQVFAGGRELSDENTVLIAAAACEMHPAAVLKGISLRSIREALEAAGGRAAAAGVRSLPAIELEGRVVTGPQCVELAVRALA
jgi:2-hydroxychromene-2-carboxylate isomerase